MKRLLSILALLSMAALAFGAVNARNGIAITSASTVNGITPLSAINGLTVTTSGGVTYGMVETFEGSNTDSQSQAGYDLTGWTSSNSANNPQYATSPAPLAGSFSLRIAAAARTDIHDLAVAGGTTAGGYFIVRWTGTQRSSGGLGYSFLDSSSTALCSLESRGGGNWRLVHGTATGSTFAITVDTTHHMWIEYTESSGANDGVVSIYISSNDTKPGSPTSTLITGTATADAAKVRLSGFSTSDTFWDNVVADGTQYIGSDPVP